MPYISRDNRDFLDPLLKPLLEVAPSMTSGLLNYALTRIVDTWAKSFPVESYDHHAAVVGTLESVKLEYYRRRVAPFEDIKRYTNGEVYDGPRLDLVEVSTPEPVEGEIVNRNSTDCQLGHGEPHE